VETGFVVPKSHRVPRLVDYGAQERDRGVEALAAQRAELRLIGKHRLRSDKQRFAPPVQGPSTTIVPCCKNWGFSDVFRQMGPVRHQVVGAVRPNGSPLRRLPCGQGKEQGIRVFRGRKSLAAKFRFQGSCLPRVHRARISNGPSGFEPRHMTRFGMDGSARRGRKNE
jgi:hypothetical protein